MFRSMASAFAGSVGSITAPLASLNQLAMSTAIVKFFVSLASVTGGSNLIAISASISEVKVKSWVVLLASVKTPVTLTLIPWKSGCAVRKALTPGSSSSGCTASSLACTPLYVPAGMATSSSNTWVVASTGRSTSVGPNCSSAQSSSSPVVAQPPAVESSIRASTTCAWLIVSELAPLPIWIAALTPDPAGTATPEAPLVTDRLTGCDVLGAVTSQAVNV